MSLQVTASPQSVQSADLPQNLHGVALPQAREGATPGSDPAPAAVEFLAAALGQDSATVQARVERYGSQELVAGLRHVLRDPRSTHNGEAARYLGSLGAQALNALGDLLRSSAAGDPSSAGQSVQALRSLVPHLNGDQSSALAHSLRYLSDAEIARLVPRVTAVPEAGYPILLSITSNRHYFSAASLGIAERHLSAMKPDSEAVPALVKLSNSSSILSDLPERIGRILAPRVEEAWPLLLEKLRDGDQESSKGAMRVLAELSGSLAPGHRLEFLATEIVRRMSELSAGDSLKVSGIRSLGRLAALDESLLASTVPALVESALGGRLYVRAEALRALAPAASGARAVRDQAGIPLVEKLRPLLRGCLADDARKVLEAAPVRREPEAPEWII